MEQKYTDDTFLARWLNKDLNEEERIAFEKTEKHKEYFRIIEKTELFQAPEFDQEAVFKAIKKKLSSLKKPRKMIPNWAYSVAASVALLVGIFYFVDKDKVYETSYGEQLVVVLPDGSEVLLNAKSKISLSEKDWEQGNRNMTLKGEGYFKVQTGSEFTVVTELGSVSVLGTQFNVKRTQGYFEVKCFEGKVSVKSALEEVVLTSGKGYFKIKGQAAKKTSFDKSAPAWITRESTFESTPLKYVIKELEKQYNITFDANLVNENQLYTGSFTNKNKQIALKTVFIPLQIVYTVSESGKIILSEN
ncbi:FecR domain-containing protein [Flavicella sp.]|uniref:FecR family protein n=1 Tax=Flavicella sp. TaxID=2957742 RepID=UPI0030186249